MSPQDFPHVFRGYDPAVVDQHLAEVYRAHQVAAQDVESARHEAASAAVELTKARQESSILRTELESERQRVTDLEDSARTAAQPSYTDLGARIGKILALADEEAGDLRSRARAESEQALADATTEAQAIRSEADRYAEETASKADVDANVLLERARSQADSIIDDAAREAAARREEAEAHFEQHRAKTAQQAADFESTLKQRRDQAAAEFNAQLAQQEQHLEAVQERADRLARESAETHTLKGQQAQDLLNQARAEASSIVAAAKDQAERIRRESDRELSAATARRDSITAQLSNVRNMLATLGGPAVAVSVDQTDAGEDDNDEDAATGEEVRAEEPGQVTDDVPGSATDQAVEASDVEAEVVAEELDGVEDASSSVDPADARV